MVDLMVQFIGDDAEINGSFREWLAGAGLAASNGGSGSVVSVHNWADCERFGEQLSRFIAGRSDPFKLLIDGPGGDALIHEVRRVADAESLTSFLATSAYFQ
ncbi:hypothetical protein [Micromonospora sp. S-DT3-3-22]|uniref:hypothetical protein n=1 Tax=Micromonospora sp. S-DT3-3-22 TaxID=2755359 RepID=UPI00188EDC9C|nr:hypothetical protein [Micromonospora sp. S-DT3-3-22]